MPYKPDKFGIKSWLLTEVDTKYIVNGFPYLGTEVDKQITELQGVNVIKKLLQPYYTTTDNFSLQLGLQKIYSMSIPRILVL